jgi:ParB/RepB/Spo0J family partition protein
MPFELHMVERPTSLSVSVLRYFEPGAVELEPNEHLQRLSDDVRQNGIREPLIVRPVGDMYEVVCGLRRWKAAILAGLDHVPVFVRYLSDEEALRLSIADNRR